MAIVGGQQQDEELQNGQPPAPGSGGGGAFVGGGSGQGATTKTAAGAPTSSGYTNLSSYLQANQGSGTTTGQAAANVVDQAGAAAQKANDAYSGAANKEVNAAGQHLGVDPGTYAKIKAGMGNAKTDDVNYAGPKDIAHMSGDTTALQGAAQGANSTAGMNAAAAGGGQSGVSGLLQQAYQQPNYSQGENSLDAFLAGGSGGQAALNSSAAGAKQAVGAYDKINDTLTGKIKNATDMAAGTNKIYNDKIASTPAYTGGQAHQTIVPARAPAPLPTPASQQTVFARRAEPAPQQPSGPAPISNNPNNMTPTQLSNLGKSAVGDVEKGKDPITGISYQDVKKRLDFSNGAPPWG